MTILPSTTPSSSTASHAKDLLTSVRSHSMKDVYDAIVSVGGKIQVALMRDHQACNVARELQAEAAVICAERYVLTEGQMEHLRRQAEKCGNVMGEA